jgi:hypothetical protein
MIEELRRSGTIRHGHWLVIRLQVNPLCPYEAHWTFLWQWSSLEFINRPQVAREANAVLISFIVKRLEGMGSQHL